MFITGEKKGATPSDTCCKDNRRYSSDYVSDSFCCLSNVLLLPLQKLRQRTAMKYYYGRATAVAACHHIHHHTHFGGTFMYSKEKKRKTRDNITKKNVHINNRTR